MVAPRFGIEGEVRRNFTFILEINVAACIHQGHRLAHLFAAGALGIAKGRIGQKRHPRFMAKAPRCMGGFDGNFDQGLRLRQFRDGGVGNEQGAALGQDDAHAHDAGFRRRVDDA